MAALDDQSPDQFIVPLYMNGLQGRMLRLPAPANKKREILFVYGHHSTIERWWGIAQDLNKYGTVTVPDLPGFGGMESMYKIGEKPDLDTMADYLAAFIKLRYNRKRLTIVAMSYGFLVATRMLQRYPDLVKKIDFLFSAAGFAHKDDFRFSRQRYYIYLALARFLALRPVTVFFRNVCLHPMVIRMAYSKTPNAKHKFANLDKQTHKRMMNFEVRLWRDNDVRTHWNTTIDMLTVDNCAKQIKLPVYHIAIDADQYFNNHRVEQHMRVIFTDFISAKAKLQSHAPSVVADASEAAPLFPAKFRRLIAKQPKNDR